VDRNERILYHQIHPLKLATDIGSAIVALALFWCHRLGAGVIVLLVPPAIISAALVAFGRLDALAASLLGAYVRRYMTPLAQLMRLAGVLALSVGASRQNRVLMFIGGAVIVWAWTRGLLTS
jgi:hypothetical protein